MDFFISSISETKSEFKLETNIIENKTNISELENIVYIQKNITYDGNKFCYHILPINDSVASLFICVDSEIFNFIWDNVRNQTKLELFVKKWPKLMSYMSNRIDQNFSNGGLTVFPDLIDGKLYWVANIMLDKVDFNNLDTTEIISKYFKLISQIGEIASELEHNPPTIADGVVYGIKNGIRLIDKMNTYLDIIDNGVDLFQLFKNKFNM
jgi:hypothetical protein